MTLDEKRACLRGLWEARDALGTLCQVAGEHKPPMLETLGLLVAGVVTNIQEAAEAVEGPAWVSNALEGGHGIPPLPSQVHLLRAHIRAAHAMAVGLVAMILMGTEGQARTDCEEWTGQAMRHIRTAAAAAGDPIPNPGGFTT